MLPFVALYKVVKVTSNFDDLVPYATVVGMVKTLP